jgi:predicted membrane protein
MTNTDKMDNDNNRKFVEEGRHDRFWTGIALVCIGAVLFTQKMGINYPYWFFDWPMILIFIGVLTGLRHGFRNSSWIILVAIGGLFLVDDIMTDWDIRRYFWPIMIIGLGCLFILRPRRNCTRVRRSRRSFFDPEPASVPYTTANPASESKEDYINSTSIFAGVKKVITSKNFKGGEIICFMGGAEYNLTQADFTGPITIEIMQAFGGTKLIVPPHWEIRTESVAIFAGVEDKRPMQPGAFDPNKVLILKGTTIFGGIEIKSY